MQTHQPLQPQAADQKSNALPSPVTRSSVGPPPETAAPAAAILGNLLALPGLLNPIARQAMPLQPKLTIGAVGDKYEQEADRVAAQVVQRLNAPPRPNLPPLQRQELPPTLA